MAGVQCREGVVAVWTLLGMGSRAPEVLQMGLGLPLCMQASSPAVLPGVQHVSHGNWCRCDVLG